MTFGAGNVFAAAGLHGIRATLLGLAAGAVIAAAFLRARIFDDWKVAPGDRAVWLSFVLGAVLLTGCFFTGTNFGYRWIFALWLAPLLWRLPRDAAAPAGVRRLATVTAGLLMIGLWADSVLSAVLASKSGSVPFATLERWADRFILWEQPIIWALFACLLGFLAHFTREGVRILFGPATVNPVAPSPSAP